ncbi:Enoyl-[acyl-carrier-protein] reductase [Dirofilaria immitis]
MPGGALCQVQNIPTNATRKVGELKDSKAITANARIESHGNEENGAKIENQNLGMTLMNMDEKINETKVVMAEFLHESLDTAEVAVQTDVIVNTKSPKLTVEDLRSQEVSVNYWRRLTERFYVERERKARINFELSIRLAKRNEEIVKQEEDYLALKHYISAEESTESISESDEGEGIDGWCMCVYVHLVPICMARMDRRKDIDLCG